MGHYAARDGVEGYLADDGTFHPNRTINGRVIPGYNDALAANKSRLAFQKAQSLERSLADDQHNLSKQYQGVNFSKALRGLFGQGGSLDPMLAGIDAAQETNKGQLYNQRRIVDQGRVAQGLPPLYNWKGGLNPPVSETEAPPVVDPAARNVTQVTPGWRDRDHEYLAQLQQHTPYWEREENAAINAATLANEDRTDGTLRVTSDMEGYEDRADIQAWLAAASPEMKENFLANRARKAEAGLLKPNPNFTPAEVSAEDIDAHIADYGGGRSEEAARDYLSGEGTEWDTGMRVDESQSPIPSQAEELSRALAKQRKWEEQQLGHGPNVYAATEGPVTLESFQPYASEKPMGDAQSMFYQYQDLYGDQGMTEADAFAIATGQRPELSAGQFKEFNAVKNKLLEDAARLRGRQ